MNVHSIKVHDATTLDMQTYTSKLQSSHMNVHVMPAAHTCTLPVCHVPYIVVPLTKGRCLMYSDADS